MKPTLTKVKDFAFKSVLQNAVRKLVEEEITFDTLELKITRSSIPTYTNFTVTAYENGRQLESFESRTSFPSSDYDKQFQYETTFIEGDGAKFAQHYRINDITQTN